MSFLLTGLLTGITLLGLIGCAGSNYETADYTVVSSKDDFEIRDYPALTLVTAPMPRRGADGAFMKLFRFISGKNDRSEKIAMTTPVFMSGAESGTMAFVLPKTIAAKGAPSPSNPDLSIVRKHPARYAVLCFKGVASPEHSLREASRLGAWVSAQGLHSAGSPVFAYYNPPWTPGFMRRNEVLIPITAAP
jgi:hypothetical protein